MCLLVSLTKSKRRGVGSCVGAREGAMLGSPGIRVGSWVGAKLGVRVGFISVCTDECPSLSSSTGARNGNDGRDLD